MLHIEGLERILRKERKYKKEEEGENEEEGEEEEEEKKEFPANYISSSQTQKVIVTEIARPSVFLSC